LKVTLYTQPMDKIKAESISGVGTGIRILRPSGPFTVRRISQFRAGFVAVGLILALASVAIGFQTRTHPLTGRRIAGVMGPAGADWLDRKERSEEERPDLALDSLALTTGMVVADVGAGTGYMSLRMAKRVGPSGKVYAEDIQPEMLALLKRMQAKLKITNVETVLGTSSDARLPTGAIDLELLVDVYHEFSEPTKMLDSLRSALRPEGRLVLLEYRKEDPKIPIRPEHTMTVQEVKTELGAAGFRMDRVIETLPLQHILIFKKTGTE
jgi:SAM-dependent methyltransferase